VLAERLNIRQPWSPKGRQVSILYVSPSREAEAEEIVNRVVKQTGMAFAQQSLPPFAVTQTAMPLQTSPSITTMAKRLIIGLLAGIIFGALSGLLAFCLAWLLRKKASPDGWL